MAVAYGASACFLIPYGYQTHLIVVSPGRYDGNDVLKTGVPVSLAGSAAVLVLISPVFPFWLGVCPFSKLKYLMYLGWP